jgi:hypothetical protein
LVRDLWKNRGRKDDIEYGRKGLESYLAKISGRLDSHAVKQTLACYAQRGGLRCVLSRRAEELLATSNEGYM